MFLLSQLYEDVDMDKSNRRIVLGSNQGACGKDLYLKSACNLYTSTQTILMIITCIVNNKLIYM